VISSRRDGSLLFGRLRKSPIQPFTDTKPACALNFVSRLVDFPSGFLRSCTVFLIAVHKEICTTRRIGSANLGRALIKLSLQLRHAVLLCPRKRSRREFAAAEAIFPPLDNIPLTTNRVRLPLVASVATYVLRERSQALFRANGICCGQVEMGTLLEFPSKRMAG
jgi:hypothetical protein